MKSGTMIQESDIADIMEINVYRENVENDGLSVVNALKMCEGDIIDYALQLMDLYIKEEVHTFCHENFETKLESSLFSLLKEHVKHLYVMSVQDETRQITLFDETLEFACEYYIDNAYVTFYTTVTPRRSYKKNGIRVAVDIEKMTKKIAYINSMYQPEQRTSEWYEYRHNLFSASSVGKLFGTKSAINQLVLEKCEPYKVFGGGSVNINSPLHWGQKYEPVSTMLYENKYHTTIGEFGCIKSDEISCIGASPDGINIDPSSKLYGRMLEIKNVVSRIITGIPKEIYWIQMQFQMFVCHLNECDFFETKFVEYENEDEFLNDGTYLKTSDNKDKGVILYFDMMGIPKYEYKPINMDIDEYNEWKKVKIEEYGQEWFIKEVFWKLDVVSCVLVLKNNLWLSYAIPVIEDVWKTVEYERTHGYDHRIPEKRKNKMTKFTDINECMIDLDENDNLVGDTFSSTESSELKSSNISTNPITNIKNFEIKIRTQSFDETVSDMSSTL